MTNVRIRLIVSGEVQGTGYRAFVKRIADRFGLSGWVKNLQDGRVEVLVEGDETKVEEIVNLCRKGPPFAKVNKVTLIRERYVGECTPFTIER